MSILIDKNTRVVTQGITGKTGQFHTRNSRDYANGKNCYVAGVNPKKAGEDFEGIPIYASVKEAKEKVAALAPSALVLVMDADGKELVAQNADEPFVPASVTKIVTTWLAIEVLGKDYRFETPFYLDKGCVLHVRGGGDPMLVSEELALLALHPALRGRAQNLEPFAEGAHVPFAHELGEHGLLLLGDLYLQLRLFFQQAAQVVYALGELRVRLGG